LITVYRTSWFTSWSWHSWDRPTRPCNQSIFFKVA